MQKVLVIGGTGLVGSYFLSSCKSSFELISLGRNEYDVYLDLLSLQEIKQIISSLEGDVVINFAAFTDVDGAEARKLHLGSYNDVTEDIVYKLNVAAPSLLAEACLVSGKKYIQLSTDYVFRGDFSERPYREIDETHPVDSWYSITKELGEKAVIEVFKESPQDLCIVRIAYPYSPNYLRKNDLLRTLLNRLEAGQPYLAITDQKINPCSVIEIAAGLKLLINKQASGIYHLGGDFGERKFITPFEFALAAAEEFNLDRSLIKPVTFSEFSKLRKAVRPKNTWMDLQKIKSLGMKFKSFKDILIDTKNQFKKT